MAEGACPRCAIQALLARYAMAVDQGRIEDVVATFTLDGVMDAHGWRAEGRAAILAELRGQVGRNNPGLSTVRHHLTSSLIELGGDDAASGRSYFLVTTDSGLDHTGVYTDRLVRDAGVWLFAQRKVRLNWISRDTMFGLAPLK
jgi:hypothetical protein